MKHELLNLIQDMLAIQDRLFLLNLDESKLGDLVEDTLAELNDLLEPLILCED